MKLLIGFFLGLLPILICKELPRVYEYYSAGGIDSALTEQDGEFMLNGKLLHILSGSLHYFRIPPVYWRDRLRKLRAAGFNTLDTYVPWAMHEKLPGQFDFTGWLDVRAFLQMAKEEDILVIFRPGPFIDSEFDFGALPGWLLRDPNMEVRSSYEPFKEKTGRFYKELFNQIRDLQWSKKHGAQPIIMMQVENEYGAFGYMEKPRDTPYLKWLMNNMKETNNMKEVMYFTCDSPANTADLGSIPGVLQAINFRTTGKENFEALEKLQPGRPKLVSEYWTGWYDHWTVPYHSMTDLQGFEEGMIITFQNNASINLYVFHGGNTYGFWAGGDVTEYWPYYFPTISTYDYDAPLTEAADYTDKYHRAAELVQQYNRGPALWKPEMPPETTKEKYNDIYPTEYLTMHDLMAQSENEHSDVVINMEALKNTIQNLGFIVYTQPEVTLSSSGSKLIIMGHIRDVAYILVDGVLVNNQPITNLTEVGKPGYWGVSNSEFTLYGNDKPQRLDIIVEALGRNDYGLPHWFHQRKGLWEGQVFLDGQQLSGWTITPMEFHEPWVKGLSDWKPVNKPPSGPVMVKASFEILGDPHDTWLDIRGEGYSVWVKGSVFVNGFNLGRYWSIGPTQTMFIAAPHLKQGVNEIIFFELYQTSDKMSFTLTQDLGKGKYV